MAGLSSELKAHEQLNGPSRRNARHRAKSPDVRDIAARVRCQVRVSNRVHALKFLDTAIGAGKGGS
jgi:hypothetical protein